MVKDGEDYHGLRMTNLKKFRLNFSRRPNRDVAPIRSRSNHDDNVSKNSTKKEIGLMNENNASAQFTFLYIFVEVPCKKSTSNGQKIGFVETMNIPRSIFLTISS